MGDITEDEKIWKFKGKTIIIGLIAIFTFYTPFILSGALVYYEFRTMQTEITSLRANHLEDDINTNARIDKKTSRNKEEIDNLKNKNHVK